MKIMASEKHPTPSILSLAWLFGKTAITTLSQLLTYPFLTQRAASLKKHLLNTAIRTLLHTITIPQLHRLNNTTTSTRYTSFCTSQNLPPHTLSIKPSTPETPQTTAHWIGDPNASIVILYFHGGGYTQPATSGTFLYLHHLIATLQLRTSTPETQTTVAALVLAYDLAPESPYPTQLKQAASTLSYLLHPTHRRPSTIFLSGDSAGGNLALALLSHILHPHPAVPAVEVVEPLAGVVLYSPMATFSREWDSVRRNESVDMIPASRIRWWGGVLHGLYDPSLSGDGDGTEAFFRGDAYTEPCLNSAGWWVGLDRVVGGVLVMCGADEVYLDPIVETVRSVRAGWVEGGEEEGVVVVETMGEAHIGPIVEFMMGGGKPGGCGSQRVVEEWYLERLGVGCF
ncbi:unnamed protein product [Periconia digitata]|uniref:Alpha/beta hydrolase fold-3 domain-containing protein n=1 Tax=Periconia digitata TaxID=1303443 RepID=A0A9W4UNE2_9PLEO|nr:unnamed protein product [Periconia digitata]